MVKTPFKLNYKPFSPMFPESRFAEASPHNDDKEFFAELEAEAARWKGTYDILTPEVVADALGARVLR